jgi:hypothetical protein
VFPGEYLDKTFDEIEKAAKAGKEKAQKAKKLLSQKEYDR